MAADDPGAPVPAGDEEEQEADRWSRPIMAAAPARSWKSRPLRFSASTITLT